MQVFSGNKLAAQPRLPITRQKGISLIPALITICIFTLLTTQIIIPNQIRNNNQAFINSMAKSAEILEQASLAYYSTNSSWPETITGHLVPDFLPAFNEVTDTGFSWQIVKVLTRSGGEIMFNMSGWTGQKSSGLLVEIGDHKLAEAVANKIGAHAMLTSFQGFDPDPRYTPSDDKLDFVLIPLVKQGIPVIDSLNIVNEITVTDIHLKGSIKSRGGFSPSFNNTLLNSAVRYSPFGHNHSSKQFKQNIHPLETPIENIYQLKPVTYDYKDAFKQYKTPNAANSEIGLIAEQVFPLIPEITLLDDDNKVMGIDYPKLSILLLSAIQALKAEVTALKTNNQQLQLQMDGLNVENEGLNIESEGLNIEGLNSANINNARTDNGTDK
jgi:hypothetical protein